MELADAYLFCGRFLVHAVTDHNERAAFAILLHQFFVYIFVSYKTEEGVHQTDAI